MKVSLSSIRTDGGTQPRKYTDPATVEEYKASMKSGASFPPVTVFHDGEDYWLADGFHRYIAAHELGLEEIDVDVRHGTVRDARLFACGANAEHGKQRTSADRRHAIQLVLSDPEWQLRSNVWVAEICRVSTELVREVRIAVGAPQVREGKNGRTIDTTNIGKSQKPKKDEAPARVAVADDDGFESTCAALREWPRDRLRQLHSYLGKLIDSEGRG